MPAFNAADYIEEAIESVLAQTYSNWELLITDDGSTDGTAEVVNSFTDARIHFFHQVNRGVSAARNLALNHASGEFITFLDADDALPPMSLEVRTELLLRDKAIDITDGILIVCEPELSYIRELRVPGEPGPLLDRLLRLDEKAFRGICPMFRSKTIGTVRFREGLSHSEDLLFYIQMAAKKELMYAPVYAPTYQYRTGTSSAMTNLDGWEDGYLKLLKSLATTPELTWHQRIPTHLRIARILLATWIRKRKPVRGISSASRALLLILKSK